MDRSLDSRRREILRSTASALVAALALSCTPGAADPPAGRPGHQRREVLAPVYEVDKRYRSMTGPQSTEAFTLGTTSPPELVWLTGYQATMVGEDGRTPMPQDFMCHSNLDFDASRHQQIFGPEAGRDGRLFTLSQGQLQIELPEGFGIPMRSDEELRLTTQVLNLNPIDAPVKVRHKVTLSYLPDSEAPAGMQPLYQVGVYGLKLVDGKDGHFGIAHGDPEAHGPGCLPGEPASGFEYGDAFGRTFAGHWVVPPGREVNHTRVTPMLALRSDTTLHYVAVHLHPFAESIALRDLTTDETVFESEVVPLEGRVGIDRVGYFASPEGIALYADHEYELVSIYDNTSGEAQDSMAVLYLYLLDRSFEKRRITG